MYYFAIKSIRGHTSLYLLDFTHPGPEPYVTYFYNDGQRVNFMNFIHTEEGLSVNDAIDPDMLHYGDLDDLYTSNALYIEAKPHEARAFRDFVLRARQYNSLYGIDDDVNTSIGSAPFYYTEGKRGSLEIDPKKETIGRRPIDIRGNRDAFLNGMDMPISSDDPHMEDIVAKFTRSADKRILARTNCVTYVTGLLSQYCGLDLDAIVPGLLNLTTSSHVQRLILDYRETFDISIGSAKMTFVECDRALISPHWINSFSEIPHIHSMGVKQKAMKAGNNPPTRNPAG